MSQADLKKEIRQILMLISSIRSKDNERYEEHVNYSNELIDFIKKIQDDMNKNWEKIHSSLANLRKSIDDSLDALLTGINPEGIQETSKSLKEIMDTMSKSMQSMNLENVMRELRAMSGGEISVSSSSGGKSKAVPLQASSSSPYGGSGGGQSQQAQASGSGGGQSQQAQASGSGGGGDDVEQYSAEEIEEIKAAYGGELPPHLKHLEKKVEEEDSGLLKPSDFFGM